MQQSAEWQEGFTAGYRFASSQGREGTKPDMGGGPSDYRDGWMRGAAQARDDHKGVYHFR